MDTTITIEDFLKAAHEFFNISTRIGDGWKLSNNEDLCKTYLKKETFVNVNKSLLKAEFVIFYNLSYAVPSFSFNIWNWSGSLLTLDEIREMGVTHIDQKEFYSVITQQEHPILFRPYFIMHPCHTEELLAIFKNKSKNIIVTFLGLITPLLPLLDLRIDYGLCK